MGTLGFECVSGLWDFLIFWIVVLSDFWTLGLFDCWTWGLWDFGNLGIWDFGHVGPWDFGIVGLWDFKTLDLLAFGLSDFWTSGLSTIESAKSNFRLLILGRGTGLQGLGEPRNPRIRYPSGNPGRTYPATGYPLLLNRERAPDRTA